VLAVNERISEGRVLSRITDVATRFQETLFVAASQGHEPGYEM
jgi:hypothetical protein